MSAPVGSIPNLTRNGRFVIASSFSRFSDGSSDSARSGKISSKPRSSQAKRVVVDVGKQVWRTDASVPPCEFGGGRIPPESLAEEGFSRQHSMPTRATLRKELRISSNSCGLCVILESRLYVSSSRKKVNTLTRVLNSLSVRFISCHNRLASKSYPSLASKEVKSLCLLALFTKNNGSTAHQFSSFSKESVR